MKTNYTNQPASGKPEEAPMQDWQRALEKIKRCLKNGDYKSADIYAALVIQFFDGPYIAPMYRYGHQEGALIAEHLADLPDKQTERQMYDAVQHLLKGQLKGIRPPNPPMPPMPLEGATWKGKPEPRKWLIQNWIPKGRLVSLYAKGGSGKSRLAMQVAAAIMEGGPCIKPRNLTAGQTADYMAHAAGLIEHRNSSKKKVLWLSWEDELDEFRRRWRMAHAAGAVLTEDPDPEHLTYIDMRALGGPLWGPEKGKHTSTAATWTDAGKRFLETLKGHDLAVIDPLAAAYASSEIDRALVRAFASALDAAAEQAGCSVLLIGHPPKEAERGGGTGYSGSTDWRNAVRAMWVIEKKNSGFEVASDGKGEAAMAWRLRLDKSSYSRDGVFLWLEQHFQKAEGDKKAQLAWRVVSAKAAAKAANPGKNITGDNRTSEAEPHEV